MTTLDRLFRKDMLTRTKDGLAWRYHAAISRRSWERACADRLAADLLARGDAGLAALVDATADEALLDRLEALIHARRRA